MTSDRQDKAKKSSAKPKKHHRTSTKTDLYKKLREGYVFKGKSGRKFKLVRPIGEGGMGAVYEVEEIGTQKHHAVKTEKIREQGQRLTIEKLIMESCRCDHMPQFKDRGKTDTFVWIAMELLGPSLKSKHRDAPHRKFSTVTCLKIAIQMLQGLRVLHEKGFVHRDLKPDNLAIGHGSKSRTIYILDTGIARQFKNVEGVPHRPRTQVKFKGTRAYSPVALQQNIENGPKDDLESWLYILALFSTGRLPWSQMTDTNEILRMKVTCRTQPDLIFGNSELLPLLRTLWTYVIGLRYEDIVDYGYMLDCLRIALNALRTPDDRFDWEKGP